MYHSPDSLQFIPRYILTDGEALRLRFDDESQLSILMETDFNWLFNVSAVKKLAVKYEQELSAYGYVVTPQESPAFH